MIEPGVASSEGAWSTLVGPGAPIDTDRYFVVCSNMLGSSYGSTNAASIDPAHRQAVWVAVPDASPWPTSSPRRSGCWSISGVTHLRAVVGPSYGGFQAFQWAVTFPDFMDGVAPVVTSPLPPQSDRREGCWNGSRRTRTGTAATTTIRGGVHDTLTALRIDTLTRYGLRGQPGGAVSRSGGAGRGTAADRLGLGGCVRCELAVHSGGCDGDL